MEAKFYKSNVYYEGLIQDFYAGAKGCFSAFMHFFYQYNQSLVFDDKISSCFKFLYLAEIENCEKLSALLLKMGGDNKYYSSSKKFLSGYNVDYVKKNDVVILVDVEIIEFHIIQLKNMITKINDKKIKLVLSEILDNKKKSLNLF